MRTLPLALLLAANAVAAPSPEAAVAKALARVDALVARQAGRDRREIAALDSRAESEFKTLKPLGWRAAAPLGAAARDPGLAPKTRLFAVSFLGRLNDPAAFAPLSDLLLDGERDPDQRLAAAQALEALDVPPAAARRTFCALEASGAPALLRQEALIVLERLGCDDAAVLERAARERGPRPSGADLAWTRRALAGLARSRGEGAVRSLLALIPYFPAGGEARAAAVEALYAHRADLPGPLAAAALPVVREALRSETASRAPMLRLVALDDALDASDDGLLPLASHPDAEVLAAAAEALARRKAVKALPALEAVAAGALNDPRFAPRPGGADPAVLLARIEKAAADLKRALGTGL